MQCSCDETSVPLVSTAPPPPGGSSATSPPGGGGGGGVGGGVGNIINIEEDWFYKKPRLRLSQN